MIIHSEKRPLKGSINVPGDKSISHRSIMLGALAEGETIINNFLMAEDCQSTIDCFTDMGVNIDIKQGQVIVNGVGLKGLKKPDKTLFVGNSGTTIRLLSGILAAQDFKSSITGDDSIIKRPMDRIISPLRMMGANIHGKGDKFPPLDIYPADSINGIMYKQEIASAQVKSAILLAGLYANEITKVIQPSYSRDHTERMIAYLGGDIVVEGKEISLNPGCNLQGREITIPGDISSAAFFIVGALLLKDSKLIIKDVGLNNTRTGLIDVLNNMGGNITPIDIRHVNNEPIGDLQVEYRNLKGIEINGDLIPRLIDEIPIIAVAASMAHGETIIRNAEELKIKESNRIKAMVNELKKMNVNIEELKDGMIIRGPNKLIGTELNTYNDHRITMALTIASLCADGESVLKDIENVKISFPLFFDLLDSIKG